MATRSFRTARIYGFGPFELDVRAAELRRDGSRVRIQEQPFRILLMLLERPGEVVLRDELRKRLWPNGTVVEVSHGINAAVQRLRECLGDSAEDPSYIETVARRGYRFKAALTGAPLTPTPETCEFDTGALTGQVIAQYRIHEKLGGGGMGVVYRAEDLNLGREVALKFVAPEMSCDPSALDRFRREARAASALNHPNVCTLYTVDEHAGQPFISMEFLEGRTLEAVLAEGPLPPARALELAADMAGALEAAHRKGIVHRDFKPGNVMVTPSGIKVLDFGLAKMRRGSAPGHVTQEGAILGTLHYMSPEQVQGKPAEAPSDIFSFGLVLYEMFAGRRGFAGENSALVLAGILTADPPVLPALPHDLELVLRRCLAKNPEERWQTAGDLKAALELVRHPVATPASIPAPPKPERWRLRLTREVSIAVALCVFVIAVVFILTSRAPWKETFASRDPKTFTISSPTSDDITRVNLSPDAKRLAFTAANRLYVRSVGRTDPVALEGTQGAGTPFWSPDGQSVAFTAAGKLKTVRLDGSLPVTICEINTNIAGDWGPDGTILIGDKDDGIFRVRSTGGPVTRVTTPDRERNETRHLLPQFLPGGKRFLYLAGSNKPGEGLLYAASLGSSERIAIKSINANARFVPSDKPREPGYLVYGDRDMLMAQRLDTERMQLIGEPISLVGSVVGTPVLSATVMAMQFSVSGSMLAYRASVPRRVQLASQIDPMRPPAGGITVVKNWMSGM